MDRNIDERFRKPRQTRGTPLHTTRNFYFLGLVGLSGLTWYLWELLPQTKKLKQGIVEGKFNYSPEMRQKIDMLQIGGSQPSTNMGMIIEKVKKNLEEKEKQAENPRPQTRLSKALNSWVLNPE